MSNLDVTAMDFQVEMTPSHIDWSAVFSKEEEVGRKFDRLPQPIPWTMDYEQNLIDTMEWLFRAGTKEVIRLCPGQQFELMNDRWYKYAPLEGLYYHICYPKEMLMYRTRYDALHAQVVGNNDLKGARDRIKLARQALWSGWRCFGHDGKLREPRHDEEFVSETDPNDRWVYSTVFNENERIPYKYWKQNWRKRCSICSEDLPKQLRMNIFVLKKLKDAL